MTTKFRDTLDGNPLQARSRALVKTLLYRSLMVVITVLVALLVTGNVGDAFNIGIVANLVKTGTYYTYERLWDRVSWASCDTGPGYRPTIGRWTGRWAVTSIPASYPTGAAEDLYCRFHAGQERPIRRRTTLEGFTVTHR
jgi:uncharacterized membrane protein